MALNACVETFEIKRGGAKGNEGARTVDLSMFRFGAHPAPVLHPRGDKYMVGTESEIDAANDYLRREARSGWSSL